MAAARPYWTGFLKLSLVTIGVRLYTATTEKERIHFHQIHEPSGERVRYQLTVPGLGPVERDEIVKGYEYEKGRYVTVEADDLKSLKLETTDTIDVTQFVDEDDLDPMFVDAPYYLVPDGSVAEEGYRVIREALRQSRKVAIGQVVMNGRERVVALRPCGDGLLVNALRFPDEIRASDSVFSGLSEAPVDEDQLSIMEQIIQRKTRKFEPEAFVDHYQQAVRALIQEKVKGQLPDKPAERKTAQVINLMDALKRSLAEEDTAAVSSKPGKPRSREAAQQSPEAKAPGKKPRAKTASAVPGKPRNQRSLLLPVSGGRAADLEEKKQVRSEKPAAKRLQAAPATEEASEPETRKRRKA